MTDLLFHDMPRVLVVDDDQDINRLLQVRLRNVGFSVTSAPDGETAIDMIWRDRPDMILLDISMPGIGGLEVLDRIRKENLDVAVVMTTAFGSETVAIDALRRGADDYLRKPFDSGEFRAVVDRTMGRIQLRRQNEQLRKQLEDELKRASEMQMNLLPAWTPEIPGYNVAAACHPAHVVGGDFYDWYCAADGTLIFALGDVMGKGLPAALLMATVRASLRPAMRLHHDPAAMVNAIADALHEDLTRTRTFVTTFVASLDPRTHRLTYVDAGHGLATLTRANGRHDALTGTDVPIGIFPDTHYHAFQVTMEPGDTLMLYSDGLQGSLDNHDMEMLATRTSRAASSREAVDLLVDPASNVGGWNDDVTIIVLRRDTDTGALSAAAR